MTESNGSGAPARALRRAAPSPGSNQAFVAVLDSVPGAWFFTRHDGSFAYVSLGACQSLGYSRQELLSSKIFDIDPEVNPEQWGNLWNGTRPNDRLTLRTTHRRRDGTDFPVEVRASRLEVDGEDLAVSYSVDLTASERTREALAKTEAELERLLNHLPDLVFRLRRAPTVGWLFASPSCQRLLGYEPSQLTNGEVDLSKLMHPHDVEAFLRLDQSASDPAQRIRFLHRDGHILWMEVSATTLQGSEDGEVVIEGVARDITQRYQAELQGRRLLAGIEHCAEAVVVTDVAGRLEYVNPAYERTTGLSSEEVLGRPWSSLEVRDNPQLLAQLPRILSDEVTWSGRSKSVRKDGQSYFEDLTISAFRDSEGTLAGLVAVKRDVTAQLKLDAQLIQAQKMDAVGRLAGGIAHDFNNLLFIVIGNIHLLKQRSPGQEFSRLLGEVQAALDRASSLVDQLLTFSRKGSVETSALALDEVLSSSHGMLSRLLGEHIRLNFSCPEPGLVVMGNAAQIEQVIINLCVNARDAMPDGGSLTVTLECVHRNQLPPACEVLQAELFARITVRDTGCGMTPDVQARMFEPFFTTKGPGKGTGLGLATAYAIVQQHHGHMHVESQPGAGTTFFIHLPMSDAAVAPPSPDPGTLKVYGENRWVLVAEDEPAVRQLLARYLEEMGFRVVAVQDGRAAQSALQERSSDFALVVLDAVMPELGGRAVLQSMRERRLETPVLFVTGYDNESLVDVGNSSNVAILPKPFDPETLGRRTAKLLRER